MTTTKLGNKDHKCCFFRKLEILYRQVGIQITYNFSGTPRTHTYNYGNADR